MQAQGHLSHDIPYGMVCGTAKGKDRKEQTMSDSISRQAAIRWVKTECNPYGKPTLDFESGKKVIEHLEQMPSADRPQGKWIPCSERLPSEEERKEWIDNNLDGIGYLYPCLVTRYSSINPDRTKNNPYVAKHYFDGEDFVNCGEEVCSEYILAWMPLPEPWKGAEAEG